MLRVGSSLASRASRRHHAAIINRVADRSLSSSTSTAADGDVYKWQFLVPPSPKHRLLMGCVAYDPAVGEIWDGIKEYLASSSGGNLPHFDYVLFTNYEQQVSALVEGHIDVAWNGPVAHVMAEDLAADRQDVALVESCGMRDVDRDFRSVALIKRDCLTEGDQGSVSALTGQTIATGSTDSPQGHLVPVDWLVNTIGIQNSTIIPHEYDLGKHGDTAIGEIEALKAMLEGTNGTSAALVSEMMYQRGLDGALDGINSNDLRETVVQVSDSPPVFDHCSFDALVGDHPSDCGKSSDIDSHRAKIGAFSNAVLSMDMNDPCQAPIMKLEGIKKQWLGPRLDPGGAVRTALNRRGLARANAGRSDNFGSQIRAFSSSTAPFSGERVAVLGAGVSGLQTVRALRAKGFDVTAFEATPTVGGLWRQNYLSYGVQVPKQLYEFPDLEFSEVNVGEYPSGAQVQKYIERYVEHFNLGDNIALNTSVNKVTKNEDGSWSVKIKHSNGTEEDSQFDKIVVATGLYSSRNPSLPPWAAGEKVTDFDGEILHSSQVQRVEQVAGKKVVVVGNGKSAVDLAVASANEGADSVTLLSRNAHWPTPRLIADLIPFQYVFLSRLGQNLVLGLTGPLPGCSPSHSSVWHSVGQYIMPPIFKVVELLFAAQFRNVSGPTSPFNKVGVVEDFYGYAQVLDYSLRDKVKSGEVDWKVGAIESFQSDATVLACGEKIPADLIICGTGFEKDYSIFDDVTKEKLDIQSDGLWLFNHTIPTNVSNLAFVGSELAVISNITGYGLQAAWLSKLWSGEIKTDKESMENEINEVKEWKRKWMPTTPSRSSLVLLHQIHWYDRIMRDMNLKVGRKSNILSEWFMPCVSSDYDGVLTTLEEKN